MSTRFTKVFCGGPPKTPQAFIFGIRSIGFRTLLRRGLQIARRLLLRMQL